LDKEQFRADLALAQEPSGAALARPLSTTSEFARLIGTRPVSFVMFDLSTCGGFIEGR
jgi:hypothetical protein